MTIDFSFHLPNKPSRIKLQSKDLEEIINQKDIGFFHLTDRDDFIEQTISMANQFSSKKHFVQIGIGGSALGPQMLVSSLAQTTNKTFSLLDNTDADYIYQTLKTIDLKQALFYVVSKSGGTAETIANYITARKMLLDSGVNEEELRNYFVFCTDPTQGQLRTHIQQNHYYALDIPANIGGRFSVLSPVGLFPAVFMGIDIQKLYFGANKIKKVLLKESEDNPLLYTAATLDDLYKSPNSKVDQTVMMPYSSKLKDFSLWFVQLWAESLGKISKENNNPIGLTPIAAYGATDQHSQVQLFMQGPNNKSIFLIHIKNKEQDFCFENNLDLPSATKLSPFNMNQLLEAEFKGTLEALKENKRPLFVLELDYLNAENLGGLILYFECLTALMGKYFKINAFDQPGVEKGKKYAFEYLNSLGK
ncbi:MAG: hypothetical protein QF441_06580 [Bacteriovoracaceae bacterium]|jgi:glucose-6-phosphate isomerase|nr:hypothetical protein [Bacteriovoracaceae bacterium]